MTTIWKQKNGVLATFLTRELEDSYGVVQKLTSLPSDEEELQALETNRQIVSRVFDIPGIDLAMGKQIHGTHISYAMQMGIHDNTDGLVTDRSGIALAVLVADCAALLLVDRVNKVAAAAHAGWRGAADGIASAVLERMTYLGAEPDLVECYISPCISLARFEVGEEVAARFPSRFVDRSGLKPHVDLQGFLTAELIQNGVPHDLIVADGRCTFIGSGNLHSYRRDGEAAGRMMAAVVLT